MANFENIAKKAFYMGIGFASYAQEKANDALKDLRVQAQKLADEMIARGEMNAEEARKFVDDFVEQAQQETVTSTKTKSDSREPRRIEIVDEDEQSADATTKAQSTTANQSNPKSEDLRQQVKSLQDELRRLKKEM